MTAIYKFALLMILLVGLPLLGVALAGKTVSRYLEFPPLTRYVAHAGFSWPVYVGLTIFIALLVGPALMALITAERPRRTSQPEKSFPWWGWGGVGLICVAWALAWTRFPWFENLQPFTFTPLWAGYILVVNALTVRRTGSCFMLVRPWDFVSVFPLSAVFWWFFEYLNRFVQNWHYVGISDFGPWEYALHATVPFSTVLPAVLSTLEWLRSYPRLTDSLRNLWPVRLGHATLVGWIVLVVACAGLMGIGVWPDYLFPLLWVSPLLIVTSLQAILGGPTVLSNLARGDWRAVWLPALAGLICGFFWEMWNVNSLAHWEYAVPYVHRYQIFEMPLLGYAGYLPFGLECVVVTNLFFPYLDITDQTPAQASVRVAAHGRHEPFFDFVDPEYGRRAHPHVRDHSKKAPEI